MEVPGCCPLHRCHHLMLYHRNHTLLPQLLHLCLLLHTIVSILGWKDSKCIILSNSVVFDQVQLHIVCVGGFINTVAPHIGITDHGTPRKPGLCRALGDGWCLYLLPRCHVLINGTLQVYLHRFILLKVERYSLHMSLSYSNFTVAIPPWSIGWLLAAVFAGRNSRLAAFSFKLTWWALQLSATKTTCHFS